MDDRLALWMVRGLIEVLDGRAAQFEFDAAGGFLLVRPDVREYHKVLAGPAPAAGRTQFWETAGLRDNGVLESAKKKLESGADQFHLAVTAGAPSLSEMAKSARRVQDFSAFRSGKHGRHLQAWMDLVAAWKCGSEDECFAMLRRVRVATIWEVALRNQVGGRLGSLVAGDERRALEELAALATGSAGRPLDARQLCEGLDAAHLGRRVFHRSDLVLGAFAAANERFAASHRRGLFRQALFAQPGLAKIRDDLQTDANIPPEKMFYGGSNQNKAGPWKTMIVSGPPGAGKSVLLMQFAARLQSEGIPHLAIRLDRLEPVFLPRGIGEQLGLPASPVSVLAGIAQERTCVLILDQLDSVSRACGASLEFLDTIYAMYHEAGAFPNMRIVAACWAQEIRILPRLVWLTGVWPWAVQELRPLADDEVCGAVSDAGFDPATMSPKQLALFRNPLNLSVLSRLRPAAASQPVPFETRLQLFEAFRESSQIECRNEGTEWAFIRETFYDLFNARRNFEGVNLCEYLRGTGRGLAARPEVRQCLGWRRQRDFNYYLDELAGILVDPAIEMDLKKTATGFLKTLPDPTLEEWMIIERLLEDSESSIDGDALTIFAASAEWYRLAIRSGAIARWLQKYDFDIAGDSWFKYLVFQAGKRFAPHDSIYNES